MSRWKVLSTKKLGPAVADQLEAKGLDVTEKEFISISYTVTGETARLIKEQDTQPVLFTSSNAVYALKGMTSFTKTSPLPVFCLEGKTKNAVQENFPGAKIIHTAENATALAEKIIDCGLKEVIFFCGNIRRDELPLLLHQHNVTVHEMVVYETKETPVRIEEAFDAVLFFSPSAVRSFFALNTPGKTTVCFSIGNTTADEIKKFTSNNIIVAGVPSEEALATTIIEYFKQTIRS